MIPPEIRCVTFDIGETLVDETRMWSEFARRLGVTPLTLSSVLGALIATGRDHHDLWDVLGVDRPTVGECVAAVRRAGLIVGVAGNQPATVERVLAAAGLEADFVASSAAWGVAKPNPAFFARLIAEANVPAESILYVGDRLDNDILPARAIGMHTVFIRRGPWGHIHALKEEVALADLRLNSLHELATYFASDRS